VSDETEARPQAMRKWIPMAMGVGLLILTLGIGSVVFSVAWMREHRLVTQTTEGSAAREFEAVLAKYPGQPPLLELRNGKLQYVESRRDEPTSEARLSLLRAMAWDGDEGKLTTVDLPFWFLRLKSGPIRLGSYVAGLGNGGVGLRPEDIERHGPGLVLDATMRGRNRVLLWVE
jgi:hypothetical protein